MKTIYLYWFNSAVMTTYEFRNFSASRFYYCVLYITFGLITTTAYSQSFDQLVGRFTQLDVAQFNPSSIILQGEIKVTQKSTFERLLEKPLRSLQAGIPVSAGRLASLGKGFLRGGLYGIALDGAMQAAGWVWDEALKNWKKILESGSKDCWQYAPTPACPIGIYKVGGETPTAPCYLREYIESPPDYVYCKPDVPPGYAQFGASCVDHDCGSYEVPLKVKGVTYYINLRPEEKPPETEVIPATDQDIFDNGVKHVPDFWRLIQRDMPSLFDPTPELTSPSSIVSRNFPEISNTVKNILTAIQNVFDIDNIVQKVFNEGTDVLTQTDIDVLEDNDIDINTLVSALTKIENNTELTDEEKNQIQTLTDIQTKTVTDLPPSSDSGSPPADITVEIPTDCDLIPFVCDWLDWFKDWLTDDRPPIPEAVIPVEELTDFNPPGGPSGSCPAPYQFSVFSANYEVSYQPFCDLALLINPVVIAISWLLAGYIVTRSR